MLAIYTRLIFNKVVMLGHLLSTESTEWQNPAPSENYSLLPQEGQLLFLPTNCIEKAFWNLCVQALGPAGTSGCRANTPLTNTGRWAATPNFVVHAGDNAVPLQLVPWRAVIFTPGAKVGTIQTLEAPVGRHGQGRATLFWKSKQRLLESC